MIGVPYAAFGLVGVMVYRHLRVHAAANPLPVPGEPNLRGSSPRPIKRGANQRQGRGMFLKAKRTGTSINRSGAW